ncbi:MAG TPA: hypothetical protein DIW36_04035, partial [Ruminococcaceae bacterium]|nr:hypothetical protein [Oscillospiraceae bacterium]
IFFYFCLKIAFYAQKHNMFELHFAEQLYIVYFQAAHCTDGLIFSILNKKDDEFLKTTIY